MRWTEEQFEQYRIRRMGDRIKAVALEGATPAPVPTQTSKQIIRQSRREPNKTERRFENENLRPCQADGRIVGYQFEAVTLRLANGVKYTPDYFTYGPACAVKIFEVKGAYVYEDAKIKLKIAASQFHCFEFYLAQYSKGEWTINRVLP